jgi:exopolysaccharide biosynthesis polyprenyl glycosylphosphotransferase
MTILSERRTQLPTTRKSALRYLPLTALSLDIVTLAWASVIATFGRERLGLVFGPADLAETVGLIGPFIVLVWLAAIAVFGGYQESAFSVGTDEFKRVFNASLLTGGVVGVGCYLARFDLPRGFFALEFLVGIPLLIFGRFVLRRALHRAHRAGRLSYRVLIAGSADHVDEIARVLSRERWLGYQVVGALTPWDGREETDAGVPVVGHTDDALSAIAATNAEVIFFAGGALRSSSELRDIVWDLEQRDVQVVVAPSVTDVSSERVRIRPVGGLPLVHLDSPRTIDATRWAKRLFDIVGSACLILLFSPVLAWAAIRIKAYDGGPAVFRHTRIGRDGREFACLKFRTMVMNAEAMMADLQEAMGASALLFKLKDDPRVTRPGTWLRKYSIDELPQLFNVFRGEMSLVGPRPQVAAEVALYDDRMARRLRVRPGMTGLWQVSGRSELSAEDAIRLDLYYVDNWSMVQDLSILARTLGAVAAPQGAY